MEQRAERQCGIVAVIGGPLRTGRRRAIDQVLRTTAPMHDGFAGGALVDTAGALLGVITSTRIRGTTVVIPASIAWKTASSVLEHGGLKRGYLGIAGQPVRLSANHPPPPRLRRAGRSAEAGLLVAAVTPESPAAAGSLIVGDIILALDANPIESPGICSICCGEIGFDLRSGSTCFGAASRTGTHYRGRASKGLMKVVLVGPPAMRARLRTQMNGSATIVGEFASLGSAQAARLDADAFMMAAGNADDQEILETLTSREIQVLELLAEGQSNKAIGQQLGISDQTVKFHVAAIGEIWAPRIAPTRSVERFAAASCRFEDAIAGIDTSTFEPRAEAC